MTQDIFGQDTSLTGASALESWNAVQLGILSHAAATADHLGAVLQAAPEFAQAQAVKGLSLMMLGRSELLPAAREALAEAERLAEAATPRERKYTEALAVWLAGRPSQAVDCMEQVLQRAPGDALAMKMSHGIRFILGDTSGMRASVEHVLPACGPDHAARGYLLGCHAFTLEETGEYDRAATTGRQALWLAPDDAWGLHAVTHVYEMTANARAGLDWLEGREAAWAHCNNFRYHVWWHKALLLLDLGETEAALALYDAEVRKDKTDDYRDIANATSLLMRLELEGVPAGPRWEELADLCARRTADGSLVFADLHYLLALAGRRPEAAQELVLRIHADAAAAGAPGCSETQERMAAPGCAAADGVEAFGAGDYRTAFRRLSAARATLQLAGGSHAQRDVFERLAIDAGIRSCQLDGAESILDDRRAKRGGSEDHYALARRALIARARAGGGVRSVPAE